ncbi:Hypothetical predicted protein [Mytilus galloprovincialis]|uniref:C-type lectin domain-containing protein n=1 Tax=Mytilus galloprovincialis TaxID=29158 RepID=A0A8B6E841_MYTGA|nr:Hypothetical predicted protein [Mytilus galloprovincialis]
MSECITINQAQFNHDFGRITGIAATIKGNILLCDYDKKNLILVDPLGNYLKKLNVDSEPYDVAITSQNIGYITQPKSRTVLQVDPDRMVELFQSTCNDLSTTVFCVSAIPNTGRDFSDKVSCFLGVKKQGSSYAYPINHNQILTVVSQSGGRHIGPCVIKFHAVDQQSFLSCTGGQHYITYNGKYGNNKKIDTIATMDLPTDICCDDNGHIYVSGQGSNNIHRLQHFEYAYVTEQHYKVLDIPLDTQHGIKEPVALCFNKDYNCKINGLDCPTSSGYTFFADICLCYKYVGILYTNPQAKQYCANIKGYLMKIDRRLKQLEIERLLTTVPDPPQPNGDIHIQGTRVGNTSKWRFDNGQDMTYFQWNEAKAQPELRSGENVLAMQKVWGSLWHDTHDSIEAMFVCEILL